MEIQISFYLGEHEPVAVTLPEGATLGHVREVLEVMENKLFIVNGLIRQDSYQISPTDKILAMPVLDGG